MKVRVIQPDVNCKLGKWKGLAGVFQEASMTSSIPEPSFRSSLMLACSNSTADVSSVRDSADVACNIESCCLHYVAPSKNGLLRG